MPQVIFLLISTESPFRLGFDSHEIAREGLPLTQTRTNVPAGQDLGCPGQDERIAIPVCTATKITYNMLELMDSVLVAGKASKGNMGMKLKHTGIVVKKH